MAVCLMALNLVALRGLAPIKRKLDAGRDKG
jgi:hypothetical protein